jgi:hypothetical protein
MDGSGEGSTCIEGKHANIDHHDEGDDVATCQKVFHMDEQGKLASFQAHDGSYECVANVNHWDPDSLLAIVVLMLKNEAATPEQHLLLQKLVNLTGAMDMAAGACVLEDCDAQELKAIFGPLMRARHEHGWMLERLTVEQMCDILEKSIGGVRLYVNGFPVKEQLDKEFEITRLGDGWAMIREVGDDARVGIAQASDMLSIGGFVSYVGTHPQGRHRYTMINLKGRPAPFDMEKMQKHLNILEAASGDHLLLPIDQQYEMLKQQGASSNVWGGTPVCLASHLVGSNFEEADMAARIAFAQKLT